MSTQAAKIVKIKKPPHPSRDLATSLNQKLRRLTSYRLSSWQPNKSSIWRTASPWLPDSLLSNNAGETGP